MITLNEIAFRTVKGWGSLKLLLNERTRETFVQIRNEGKFNEILISLDEFTDIITQLRSSMKFSDGPFSFEATNGVRTSKFIKEDQAIHWIAHVKGHEFGHLIFDSIDLNNVLHNIDDLLSYYD